MNKLRPLKKAIAPFLLSLVGVAVGWVTTGDFSEGEALMAASGILGALGVWVAPNIESAPWLKALVPAFMGAVALAQRTIETQTFDATAWRILGGSALSAALVYIVRNGTGYHTDHSGALPALLVLVGASVLVAVPTALAASATVTARVDLTLEDTNGFVKGFIADWQPDGATEADRTQFRLFVNPDDIDSDPDDGVRSELSTEEWSVELYAGSCADPGALVTEQFFINHKSYGPSMNLFVKPAVLEANATGCLFVVHDGPTPTQHAIDAGESGRHVNAKVPIADHLVLTP